MKLPYPISVKDIAQRIGARQIIGDDTLSITGINEIHKVVPGDLMFSDLPKYFDMALKSPASVIILSEPANCPPGKAILVHDSPFEAYNGLVREFREYQIIRTQIDPSAVIHPSAIIEPGVVIGPQVVIGEDSHIQANAVIFSYVTIGKRVIIQPGAMIGTEAFYLKRRPTGHTLWNSCGRVIIEDDVFIGANTTVAKGVSGDTIIGEGTKIDNLVHIGHGVVLGKRCVLAAQVGIGGKTIIEDDVVLYGQVGVAQNVVVGAAAVVLGKSGVTKDLDGGKTYFGIPCTEIHEKYRELAALRKLPDVMKSIEQDK